MIRREDSSGIDRVYWGIQHVAKICDDYCKFMFGKNHERFATSKIRFWETELPILQPKHRDRKGYRRYTENEVYEVMRFTGIMESGDFTIQGGIKEFNKHKPLRMVLRLQRVDKDVQMPTYGSEGAACFDLRANESVTIEPGDTVIVKTGLIMEVPFGHEVVIRPRSGMSLKTDLRIANSPGTIDSDYRGEVGILVDNIGEETFEIEKGDRIAQGKLQKADQCQFFFVNNLTETERGEGGYGSTGT